MINRLIFLAMLCFSLQTYADPWTDFKDEKIENLTLSLTNSLNQPKDKKLIHRHIVQSVSSDGSLVTLEGGMSFDISWWYRTTPKSWKAGDRLYITYHSLYTQFKIEHSSLHNNSWGTLKNFPSTIPTIKSIPSAIDNVDAYSKVVLSNGSAFRSHQDYAFASWTPKDRIIPFANSKDTYQVWNIDKEVMVLSRGTIEIEDILGLEARLNKKVLQQQGATKAVYVSLLNYSAGLKAGNRPIGVFLFLGPTGVGKTELAKTLTNDVYKDPSKMLRFDMSLFSEPHSISKLMGSPPGYVHHEEGGQLTNPLVQNSQTVVLFDEIEKAHPEVLKAFLSVFDEGFLIDNKNNKINCSETMFIMTSNLCGEEIAMLFNQGFKEEEVLRKIEPKLMKVLSPELYNRVQPVVFRPLAPETMVGLVDLFLKRLSDQVQDEQGISLTFDQSLKDYLIEYGYHPSLGARPLKQLIDKRIVSALAYKIIHEEIQDGSSLTLFYVEEDDEVVIVGS